jgi:hypothetical protein
MSQRPHKRTQGEFELRVLKDGRLVMIAPDETLLEIGHTLDERGKPDAGPSDPEEAGPESPVAQ